MELDVKNNDAKTDVGSYFISNYPPYSAWKREHVSAALDVLGAPLEVPPISSDSGAARPPLGLYLHIPFCRKRCKFCYFRVYTDKNSRDVETYMQALADEIALYAKMPRLAGRSFDFVYFGGGTPSFLSRQQLEKLIERINRHWRWDAAREVTFECEPGTLKLDKLHTIKSIGVTRLSLGIEHFDDAVLKLNGRAHLSAEIERSYAWAREVGFRQINVDLIAGMIGDTERTWMDTVEKTLALAPDSLTIYQLELPHNAVFSEQIKSGETLTVADWDTKRRWVSAAQKLFRKAGYTVSSGYTLAKPSVDCEFRYRDALWHGADMVGVGVSSIAHVGGVNFQNVDRWSEYVETVNRGDLPINRALPLTDHQRLVREMILQFKLGKLDAEYFQNKFGVDIRERFAEPLGALERDGFAQRSNGHVQLTPAGLLRVDGLLPRFFEPEYQRIRYT